MPHYPGQQRRRWPLVVVAGLVAALAGVSVGWATSGGAQGSPAKPGGAACPGGRDDAGRRAAAACLVTSYFALGDVPPAQRDERLAGLVVPGRLEATRAAYKPLDAKVATEYAAVAATNLTASRTDTVDGQAWVAFVDNFKDGSPALAQWWITAFTLQWQGGRWWLGGGVATQVDATPQTASAARRSGFGPGWVAVGGA